MSALIATTVTSATTALPGALTGTTSVRTGADKDRLPTPRAFPASGIQHHLD